ncbi:MAG TPA: glycosyltransferase family 4 protein [Bacteroidales bacterium]|nr:glycosyltransferase family 4 protein [Bacteroidales bacterium]
MKIHVISETDMVMKATGVHTAYLDHVELLRQDKSLQVVINNEGRGDIFHSHTYGPYYLIKGIGYRGRRVFTAHVIPDSIKGSLPFWKLFFPFVRLGLKLIYSYADVCIAISPDVERAIIDSGARTRIVRINNPVHPDTWKRTEEMRSEGRKILGVGEDDFVVLGVGQVIGRKGVDEFIEISERLPGAKFIWAGGRPFGKLTEGIKRIDEKFAYAGKNLFKAGPFDISEMPRIYAAGDLLLFTSYQENCPLTPIEAAASGMPVIFRDLPEYRSLYENPYLKASDKDEFVFLTMRMMNDRDFYEEGLRISQRLLYQFDKDKIRETLKKLYWELRVNSTMESISGRSAKKLQIDYQV